MPDDNNIGQEEKRRKLKLVELSEEEQEGLEDAIIEALIIDLPVDFSYGGRQYKVLKDAFEPDGNAKVFQLASSAEPGDETIDRVEISVVHLRRVREVNDD